MNKEKNRSEKEIISAINEVLEEIRPSLAMDGGDIQFVSFDQKKGVLEVRLIGRCAHCPMSQITLKQGVEAEIKRRIGEVREVREGV